LLTDISIALLVRARPSRGAGRQIPGHTPKDLSPHLFPEILTGTQSGRTVLETSTKNHQQPVHLLTASHEIPPEKGVREPIFNAQNVQLFIGLGISSGGCGSLSNLFLQ